MHEYVRTDLMLWQLPYGDEPERSLPAQLFYSAGDPYAVELSYIDPAAGWLVRWFFGRDLLLDGVTCPVPTNPDLTAALAASVGEGNIVIGPAESAAWLDMAVFTDPEPLSFTIKRPDLEDFAERTLRLVDLGAEHPIAAPELEAWLQGVGQ